MTSKGSGYARRAAKLTCDLLDERFDLPSADRGSLPIQCAVVLVDGLICDGPSIRGGDDLVQLSIDNCRVSPDRSIGPDMRDETEGRGTCTASPLLPSARTTQPLAGLR